jgi:hypothetical protein
LRIPARSIDLQTRKDSVPDGQSPSGAQAHEAKASRGISPPFASAAPPDNSRHKQAKFTKCMAKKLRRSSDA